MKVFKRLTNGMVIILFSIMHTQLAFSNDGFGMQFKNFAKSAFFNISKGMQELPAKAGETDFESASAFWFFYWGILVLPIGLLVHSIERKYKTIPHSFTLTYLCVIIIGCYMVPDSGMTYFMLPHAIIMVVFNYRKRKKLQSAIN